MGDLVAGATLWRALELLFTSVGDATHKLAQFSSDLNRLKSTLSDIKLLIDDIYRFNNVLDRPQQEMVQNIKITTKPFSTPTFHAHSAISSEDSNIFYVMKWFLANPFHSMGDVVAGAALGTTLELLFTSVADAAQNLAQFSSDLNRLKSTLSDIKLLIDDIDRFNSVLDRPQEETRAFVVRLIEGEKLVQKCSNVARWNVCRRLYYSIKLRSLEASLVTFFQINVAALNLRESRRISAAVRNMEETINEMMITLLDRNGVANDG